MTTRKAGESLLTAAKGEKDGIVIAEKKAEERTVVVVNAGKKACKRQRSGK